MGRINWHRQHRWSGIIAALLILIFSVSGIILNHRSMVADLEVSRSWLPSRYGFSNWNGGLLRGTVPCNDSILIYGSNGIWITDSTASSFRDFNHGLPEATDHRQIKGLAERHGVIHAVTPEALYKLIGEEWEKISLGNKSGERLSDITANGDTLIVVGRSNLYISTKPGRDFEKIQLPPAQDSNGNVSLFRTVWMLHSGELFGTIGKLIVDFIALIFIVLSITGIIIWLLPKDIRHRAKHHKTSGGIVKFLKLNLLTHDKIGRMTFVLLLLTAVTGWCLRPPLMIPLAIAKTPAVPGSALDNENPWHDKLRMMRYDDRTGKWMISTSDGFYSTTHLTDAPVRISDMPPVSVMGLNVWEKDVNGDWLCGSFSGMFHIDRHTGSVTDFFSGEIAEPVSGPPFGKFAVSGYSKEFNTVVEYYDGTDAIAQPEEFRQLPMSLWNVALEAHSGRLFIGTIATYVFILLTGLVIIWCIWTGKKSRENKPHPSNKSH